MITSVHKEVENMYRVQQLGKITQKEAKDQHAPKRDKKKEADRQQ